METNQSQSTALSNHPSPKILSYIKFKVDSTEIKFSQNKITATI